MKGCISYEIVRLMAQGMHPQKACEKAVFELEQKLIKRRGHAGDLSVVAMNKDGEFGVATNIEAFSFVVCLPHLKPTVYLVQREGNHCTYQPASQQWLDEYMQTRMAPFKEK